ncbi:hypothetical protein CsatB_000592 [Cannabis sativa]
MSHLAWSSYKSHDMVTMQVTRHAILACHSTSHSRRSLDMPFKRVTRHAIQECHSACHSSHLTCHSGMSLNMHSTPSHLACILCKSLDMNFILSIGHDHT